MKRWDTGRPAIASGRALNNRIMEEDKPPLIKQASAKRIRSWNRFYWLAVVWLIGYLGIIAKQAVSHDQILHGIREGATLGAITSWFMLIVTVPLGFVGLVIASWKPLRAYRLWISLLLPVFISFVDVVTVAIARVHPHQRFESVTGVRFPADANVVRCSFAGTGFIFSDPQHVYEFTCSPAETERLIRELELKQDNYPAGGTSAKGWKVDQRWTSGFPTGKSVDVLELETDASRTRVRVIATWI